MALEAPPSVSAAASCYCVRRSPQTVLDLPRRLEIRSALWRKQSSNRAEPFECVVLVCRALQYFLPLILTLLPFYSFSNPTSSPWRGTNLIFTQLFEIHLRAPGKHAGNKGRRDICEQVQTLVDSYTRERESMGVEHMLGECTLPPSPSAAL